MNLLATPLDVYCSSSDAPSFLRAIAFGNLFADRQGLVDHEFGELENLGA